MALCLMALLTIGKAKVGRLNYRIEKGPEAAKALHCSQWIVNNAELSSQRLDVELFQHNSAGGPAVASLNTNEVNAGRLARQIELQILREGILHL